MIKILIIMSDSEKLMKRLNNEFLLFIFDENEFKDKKLISKPIRTINFPNLVSFSFHMNVRLWHHAAKLKCFILPQIIRDGLFETCQQDHRVIVVLVHLLIVHTLRCRLHGSEGSVELGI